MLIVAAVALTPGAARAQDAGTEPPLDAPPPSTEGEDGAPAEATAGEDDGEGEGAGEPTGTSDAAAPQQAPAPRTDETLPPPPPEDTPPPPPAAGGDEEMPPEWIPPQAEEPPDLDDFRFVDANTDRVLITSTAETHPEGTFYFTDYELVLLQFGYAITDHVQISLTGVPPLVENQPYFFDLAIKGNVVRNDTLRLALIGALDVVVDEDGDTFWGARPGAVGTLCFGQTCQSNVSAGLGTFVNDDLGDFVPFTFNLGVIGRVSELVAFLVEPIFLGVLGDETEVANGMLLNYGVRLSGEQWGLDVGFTKVIPFEDSFDDPFILGWPIVSFTYRTEGNARGSAETAPPMPPPDYGTPQAAAARSLLGF